MVGSEVKCQSKSLWDLGKAWWGLDICRARAGGQPRELFGASAEGTTWQNANTWTPLVLVSLVKGEVSCSYNGLKQRQRNSSSVMEGSNMRERIPHLTASLALIHHLMCQPGLRRAPLPPLRALPACATEPRRKHCRQRQEGQRALFENFLN